MTKYALIWVLFWPVTWLLVVLSYNLRTADNELNNDFFYFADALIFISLFAVTAYMGKLLIKEIKPLHTVYRLTGLLMMVAHLFILFVFAKQFGGNNLGLWTPVFP